MSDTAWGERTVSAEGVTVQKSITTEQFKTPAVAFAIQSDRDTEVRLRITDGIPGTIPTNDIGFHPDYGGEHWSIHGDVVLFERTLSPGEDYTTVYGVRDVDEDTLAALLERDPILDFIHEADAEDAVGVDSLVGTGDDLVRDVSTGTRTNLPGVDKEGTPPGAVPSDAPFDLDAVTTSKNGTTGHSSNTDDFTDVAASESPFHDANGAVAGGDADTTDDWTSGTDEDDGVVPPKPMEDDGSDTDPPADANGDTPTGGNDSAVTDADHHAGRDETSDSIRGEGPMEHPESAETTGGARDHTADSPSEEGEDGNDYTGSSPGEIARTLAKELREGTVSPADKQLLRNELALGDGTVDARLEHLQVRTSDLEAYTAAFEPFLDSHGDPRDAFDTVTTRVDRIQETMSRLQEDCTAVSTETDRLADQLQEVADDVEVTTDRVSSTVSTVEDFDDRIETVAADLETLQASVDADVDALQSDIDDVEHAVETVETVTERLESVETTMETLQAEVDEIATFRDQLFAALDRRE